MSLSTWKELTMNSDAVLVLGHLNAGSPAAARAASVAATRSSISGQILVKLQSSSSSPVM